MRRPSLLALLVLVAVGGRTAVADEKPPVFDHEIVATFFPETHRIVVLDAIRFPEGSEPPTEMRLHAGLKVEVLDDSAFDVTAVPDKTDAGKTGHGEEGKAHGLRIRTYRIRRRKDAPPEASRLKVKLSGEIHHPLTAVAVEYARSFSRTPGTIEKRGVFLSGASWWVPRFGDELVTFKLAVTMTDGWKSVSQGERTISGTGTGRRMDRWECSHPMDEIYLVANKFSEYARTDGNLTSYAFLRKEDPNLANKYLEVTAQYVDMYRRLIGRYPYAKFAVIENFWETGYGMPSFTLLGPKVIRFPFILHSSYPHEILHNWWGNSVYVDWETGNWCEGLTAYLADHLVKEGQGRGAEYRRDTLKNYRNYVNEGKDFPLSEFRSRHSSATQAVGYGKCLMLFHMLRLEIGDDLFKRGLQRFYRAFRFQRASFDDIAGVFSEVVERDLGSFFDQWVKRKGAPELELEWAQDEKGDATFTLKQIQEGEPYVLTVPVLFTFDEERSERAPVLGQVRMTGRQARIPLPADADDLLRVDVDPAFDVFRRLDRDEIPPTLSEMFGAEEVTIVLPREADPLMAAWRRFGEGWARGRGGKVQVVEYEALKERPKGRAVWVLGRRNPLREIVRGHLMNSGLERVHDTAGFRVGKEAVPLDGHSFVVVARVGDHPMGWIGSTVEAALPGLARKLPHYGKYSYLAFHGEAPDNVMKGTWPATGKKLARMASPVYGMIQAKGSGPVRPRGKLPARQPLERLAPVFDAKRLKAHVDWLADDAREGRGVGTKGLDESAEYIAAAFKQAGLKPGGDDGTFFQRFEVPNGPDGKPVVLRNVIGLLPGTNADMKGQSVVLGAHYDHLGRGWPDVRKGNEGKIHNGADDNASGVSVLLELAHLLGRRLEPARSVVFAAFSGEEWGLRGSTHYVADEKTHPASKAIAMVNMDAVGRLDGKKLLVLGSGTASEWRHIAMGVGFTTGVESTCVADDPGGGDQVSFHRARVPAVQVFTGATEDYHRPSDTADKIDVDGLVRVATWVRETIVYLSERPGPLAAKFDGEQAPPKKGPRAGRRVSFGTMPEFEFGGPGVKVAGVIEGSGAQAAGLEVGDILLSIDGEALKDLRAFSNVLKKHEPGDVVKVVFKRGGEEKSVDVTLKAR